MAFTSMTTAQALNHVRSDTYFAERVAGAGESKAAAYRRAREQLKPYSSAIVFPEALLLLPESDLRRRVWAVDFEVIAAKDGAPAIVASKVRKIDFFDLADERDLAMVYKMPEEIVEADLAGIRLVLCRRLRWVHNAYDPIARLRLYLPGALMQRVGGWPGFSLDALFANRADALNYQTATNLRLWSSLPCAG